MQSRDEIKHRMLRLAAKTWGYDESQMEADAFDPLVSLLFEACSTELERISREMDLTEERILDRILALLTPEELVCAKPAHAILHARPTTPVYELKSKNMFYGVKKLDSQSKDIFFSPVGPYHLSDCGVVFVAAGNRVYKVDEMPKRHALVEGVHDRCLDNNVLWLGLDWHSQLSGVEWITFFFNWRNLVGKENYLQLLSQTRWYLNGIELLKRTGLYKSIAEDHDDPSVVVSSEFNITKRFENQIENFYNKHFVSVEILNADAFGKEDLCDLMQVYPEEFLAVFPQSKLESLEVKSLWLKIEFPEFIPADILPKVECFLNCFPIMNRRYISENHKLRENANIISLRCDELFFDIDEITDQNGNKYRSVPLSSMRKYSAGEYTMRKRGINKFNQSDATRSLLDLIDNLRDESAAFSAYNYEYLSKKVRLLNQEVNELEHDLLANQVNSGTITYLIVKPVKAHDHIQVGYWSTVGAEANGIPSGASIDLYQFTALRKDSLYLLTGTDGARDELTSQESRFVFKKALTNRERIVSVEDIKSFCMSELGGLIQGVEIKRGFRIGTGAKIGIERIMEVWLRPSNSTISNASFLVQVAELEILLNQKSSSIIPIAVAISNE